MIIKATKKPVTIEAIQLTEVNVKDVYIFIYGDDHNFTPEKRWADFVDSVINNGFRLMTLESHGQTQVADIGDYIIKGVHGEFYPCKPAIFSKNYDIIEAVLWDKTGRSQGEMSEFLPCKIRHLDYSNCGTGDCPELYIETLEGRIHVSEGDYVIKGINGEFYPCKPDIFSKTYDIND